MSQPQCEGDEDGSPSQGTVTTRPSMPEPASSRAFKADFQGAGSDAMCVGLPPPGIDQNAGMEITKYLGKLPLSKPWKLPSRLTPVGENDGAGFLQLSMLGMSSPAYLSLKTASDFEKQDSSAGELCPLAFLEEFTNCDESGLQVAFQVNSAMEKDDATVKLEVCRNDKVADCFEFELEGADSIDKMFSAGFPTPESGSILRLALCCDQGVVYSIEMPVEHADDTKADAFGVSSQSVPSIGGSSPKVKR